MDYKIGYLIAMILMAVVIACFVYKDTKSKKKTLSAFVITFIAISAIYSIKYSQ